MNFNSEPKRDNPGIATKPGKSTSPMLPKPESILDVMKASAGETSETPTKQPWWPYLGTLLDALCPEDAEGIHATLRFPESDKTIKCNRLLLQLASPVFKCMFDARMKEQITGDVEIKEADAVTMETIINFYQSGTLPQIGEIDHEAAEKIIDRYQFEGFKEAVAKNLMDKVILSDDMNEYRLLFAYYGNEVDKTVAAKEIAGRMLSGHPGPVFLTELSPEDFFTFARAYVRAVKNLTDPKTVAEKTKRLFLVLHEWSNEQSRQANGDAILEVILMILQIADIRGLDCDFVRKYLITLPVRKEFGILFDMLRSALDYSLFSSTCSDCKKPFTCQSCNQRIVPPFHSSATCSGYHRCPSQHYSYRVPYAWKTDFPFLSVEPADSVMKK